MKHTKFDYHVQVDADYSKSKWFKYRQSAIKYAIKCSEEIGATTLYEYEVDENGKHHLICASAV